MARRRCRGGAEEVQAATLAHAEQVRAAPRLTEEQGQGHTPRLPLPKPHQQHAQAKHPAAAAAAAGRTRRTAAAAVTLARKKIWGGGRRTENKVTCRRHVSGNPLPFRVLLHLNCL